MSLIYHPLLRRIAPLGLLPFLVVMIGCPTSRVDDADVTVVAIDSDQAVAGTPQPSTGTKPPANEALHLRVADALKANLQSRRLATDVNGAWQVMHGVLAYGRDFSVATASGPQPAVTYVLSGGPLKGFLLRGGDKFEIDGRSVRGVVAELQPGEKIGQGHRDQWVAYMADSGLKPSDVVVTADGPLTVEGWIRQIEWDVPRNFEGEYSWTLTALLAHRPTTHRWTARDGSDYSIETLLESEVSQLSPTSACGGSHRLCAIAAAVNRHRAAGQPIIGVWADAEMVVEMAIEQSRDFQNADGSFSSHYFERPGWSPDLVAVLGTSGHVFEFLAVAGSDELLAEPWVQKAANNLCDLLERTSHIDLECGALYHALSGLSIFAKRTGKLLTSG